MSQTPGTDADPRLMAAVKGCCLEEGLAGARAEPRAFFPPQTLELEFTRKGGDPSGLKRR